MIPLRTRRRCPRASRLRVLPLALRVLPLAALMALLGAADRWQAMPMVTARLRMVPMTVIAMLTVTARVTTPPAKIVRYA